MNDGDLRAALHEQLRPYLHDPEAVVVNELGLLHGAVRTDVALVNGEIHGFELKSASDSLDRLPAQVQAYSRVLDRATLVVAERHLAGASLLIPTWWGVQVARTLSGGAIALEMLRPAAPNPSLDLLSVVRLLWREEAVYLLAKRALDRGYRSKAREIVYRRLVEAVAADELRRDVRSCLRYRLRSSAAAGAPG